MPRSTLFTVALAIALSVMASPARTDGAVVRDPSDLDPSTGGNLASFVAAEDFVLEAPTRLSAASIWIGDAAGTHGLALHEGPWGSISDGSNVHWVATASGHDSGAAFAAATAGPGSWRGGKLGHAFVLFDEIVFASGFEAGGSCGWSGSAGGVCP